MKLQRRGFLHMLTGVAAFQAVSCAAWAQSYPAKPVRVIVPFAPAGPADVLARLMMSKLTQSLGQQFYIENLAGAGGNLGMGGAARAAPDGYTIAVVSTSLVRQPEPVSQDFRTTDRISRRSRSPRSPPTCWWFTPRSRRTTSRS